MNTSTGTFSQVIDPAVRAIFDKALADNSSYLYAKNIGWDLYDPDVPEPQLSEMSSVGAGGLIAENVPYTSVQKYKGFPMTVTHRKYGLDFSYTEEDIHWIEKQGSSKKSSSLTRAANGVVNGLYYNMNLDACKLFYLGFGTTFLTGGNSEALFASHTIRKTGGTQLNTFASGSTHRPFGPDAFSDAMTILNRLKSHNDIQLLPVRRARVFCSVDLEADVVQVLNSIYGPQNSHLGLQVGSKEFMAKRGITVDHMVLSDIPSAYKDYWFVADLDRMKDSCVLSEVWGARLSDDVEKSKGTFNRLGSEYFGFGWTNPTWAFGSKGDNSTI